jgi:hypothetical protein
MCDCGCPDFEIAIGSGVHKNELQAQRARYPADPPTQSTITNLQAASIGYQLAEQLQLFWPQLGQ